MLNLQEVEVFLAAAEWSNFSEAARHLHISQPAISQTIQNLEKHFGTQLFIRQGRKVALSDAGQTLLPMARELLAVCARLEESMASLQGAVTGRTAIGCSTASGKYLLPGMIARFRQQFPQVRIDVELHSREGVLHRLIEGQIGIGVSSQLVEHHSLDYQHFYTDEVILIVPADHPWTRNRQVLPDDLLDIPLILRENGSGTRTVLYQGLLSHDLSPDMLKEVMVLGNAEAIVMAVGEGIGAAFVSRLSAAQALALGTVVEVSVSGMVLKRSLYFVRNRNRPFTRCQAEFWQFMQRTLEASGEAQPPANSNRGQAQDRAQPLLRTE